MIHKSVSQLHKVWHNHGMALAVVDSLLALFPHSVESSDLNWKQKKSGGIKIICQSDIRDFSAMAFITDHVNSLIEQWFPGEIPLFLSEAPCLGVGYVIDIKPFAVQQLNAVLTECFPLQH